ncbi:hypothetical protein HDU93_006755, partial [Gonapodya sp. JEL0774]
MTPSSPNSHASLRIPDLPDSMSAKNSLASGSGNHRGSIGGSNPVYIAEEIATQDGQRITVLRPMGASSIQSPSGGSDRKSETSSNRSQPHQG